MGNLESPKVLQSCDEDLGRSAGLLSFFRAWNDCSAEKDKAWLDRILSVDRDLLLTWEPWDCRLSERKEQQSAFSLHEILSGRYELFIRRFAGILRESLRSQEGLIPPSRRILFRPMHEMNGNWYPWGGRINGNSPDLFVKTWRYLRRLFREEQLLDLQWVWCPYVNSFPVECNDDLQTFFPGNDQLEWIGLDGYNWGTSKPWSRWQEFNELFGDAYQQVRSFSRHRVIIAETACAEEGGDKSRWIQNAFITLRTSMPAVTDLVWFDENKECDWRIASNPESLRIFRDCGKETCHPVDVSTLHSPFF